VVKIREAQKNCNSSRSTYVLVQVHHRNVSYAVTAHKKCLSSLHFDNGAPRWHANKRMTWGMQTLAPELTIVTLLLPIRAIDVLLAALDLEFSAL